MGTITRIAVTTSSWQHHVAAILETWLGGQAVGGAVSDLLLGRANPSGRLAETLPLRLEDNPSYLNFPGEDGHVRYAAAQRAVGCHDEGPDWIEDGGARQNEQDDV